MHKHLSPTHTGRSATVAFPDLPTGREFREHTQSFLLYLRKSRLQALERLLDDYKVSLDEYRSLCTVRDHGATALQTLNDEYLEALQLREFQRRYCLERARWEPGLTLEQRALQRLTNQTAINPGDVELLRETIAAVCHPEAAPPDFDTAFEKLQLRRKEEQVLQILELTEDATAGRSAIADLKRAEALLSENAAAGEWLARMRDEGHSLPELVQMQAQLSRTEERIEQLRDSREKRSHHLRLHAEHLETVCSATAARLVEVSKGLHEVQDEHFETLVKRDKEGLLWRLRESTRNVEALLARGGARGTA
jgi:hypothetical protein